MGAELVVVVDLVLPPFDVSGPAWPRPDPRQWKTRNQTTVSMGDLDR